MNKSQAFDCPQCKKKTLELQAALELPARNEWNEVTAQLFRCTNCQATARAYYLESRGGALDSEVIKHPFEATSQATHERLLKSVASCRTPQDKNCRCLAHNTFKRRAPLD